MFANSRRLAERLTARFNEIATDRAEARAMSPSVRAPAALKGASGQSEGAPTVIARAHHGSVSKEQRALIEDDLKRGRHPRGGGRLPGLRPVGGDLVEPGGQPLRQPPGVREHDRGAVLLDEVPEGSAAGSAERRGSIWPHVEERVVDLVEQHRSTIVFANSGGWRSG